MSIEVKNAVIIGAGPAGLTAALELLRETNVKPQVFDLDNMVGGISRTVDYKGNKIDIGGHRFFSRSDRVMNWWLDILPLDPSISQDLTLTYQNKNRELSAVNNKAEVNSDKVMLVRNRLSRIFFIGKFFRYPISLNLETIVNLGLIRLIKIFFSYVYIRLFPIKPEKSLADFYINRFGRELYKTFFRDYTEKVWGVKCEHLSAEWGAQRVKGLSITAALKDAAKKIVSKEGSFRQKGTETSLIEKFLYPKFGPGQMWAEVSRQVQECGGEICFNRQAVKINLDNHKVKSVVFKNKETGEEEEVRGDYFFSTMPVRDLILNLVPPAPEPVREVASRLEYRDFITVGLLLKKPIPSGVKGVAAKDNWIYIQEPGVKVGRLQIFNNWSEAMVKNQDQTWVGMEYFCNEGDELWTMEREAFIKFATAEMLKMKLIEEGDVLDATVIKMPKTYPSYHGGYEQFEVVREFVDKIENLFLIGRNGMHRYNNQDHSMLTAMMAVENIKNGIKDKSNIWAVNADQEYHEEKK